MYNNEDAVGAGITAAAVDREDVFVTTKLNRENVLPARLVSSVGSQFYRTETAQIDLLFILVTHRVIGSNIADTIGAMNELQDRGLVHQIGVSNFSIEQTRAAMEASRMKRCRSLLFRYI